MLILAGLGLSSCLAESSAMQSVCKIAEGPALVSLMNEQGPVAIHRTEVTQAHFIDFVTATGYVSVAERDDPAQPDLHLGSAVFRAPSLTNPQWWGLDRAANWQHPQGKDSETAVPRSNEPVVHIAYPDAIAYADWVGGRLPTLIEWRQAALGGESWTEITAPPETANTWQGAFPIQNSQTDGYNAIAPVAKFPPNSIGLYDMVGNAWEWTATPAGPEHGILAGGSFLCDVDFCRNGTPFGQQVQELGFSASHIGFRLVFDSWPEGCE
jgi:sulfatase modifying factor 1